MALTGIDGISSGIDSSINIARQKKLADDVSDFAKMLQNSLGTTDAPVVPKGRLNGDYTSGFHGAFTSPLDKTARPTGMAHNAPRDAVIDKTSELYESALEFESYFVKIMLSSMRNSVMKAETTESFAAKMYEDMLYDELAGTMTKNAGFGLADQIYLELTDR